jgi:hypothetical protein
MRLLIRLITIITALSFAASSTLSAMPLVWCTGSDGHRAVETMLHQHGVQAADPSGGERIATASHSEPCSDWQLLSTAGPPQVKSADIEPKALTVVMAYPPLKLVVEASFPAHGARHTVPCQPRPGAHLCALRSVVLLI